MKSTCQWIISFPLINIDREIYNFDLPYYLALSRETFAKEKKHFICKRRFFSALKDFKFMLKLT